MQKEKKPVKKQKLNPDLARMDSISKAINYQMTQAAVKGNRPEVKRLKTEMVNLDKKANAQPVNQPTRFKKAYNK